MSQVQVLFAFGPLTYIAKPRLPLYTPNGRRAQEPLFVAQSLRPRDRHLSLGRW